MKNFKVLLTFIVSHQLIFADYCGELKGELSSIESKQAKVTNKKTKDKNNTLDRLVKLHDSKVAQIKIYESLIALKQANAAAQDQLQIDLTNAVLDNKNVKELIDKIEDNVRVIATHRFVNNAFSKMDSPEFKKLQALDKKDNSNYALDYLNTMFSGNCKKSESKNLCENFSKLSISDQTQILSITKSYGILVGKLDEIDNSEVLKRSRKILEMKRGSLFNENNEKSFSTALELYRLANENASLVYEDAEAEHSLSRFKADYNSCQKSSNCETLTKNIKVLARNMKLNSNIDEKEIAEARKIASDKANQTLEKNKDKEKELLSKLDEVDQKCSGTSQECITKLQQDLVDYKKSIVGLINNDEFKNLERAKALIYGDYQKSCLSKELRSLNSDPISTCDGSQGINDHTKVVDTLYEKATDILDFENNKVIAQNYSRFLSLSDNKKDNSYWYDVQKELGCSGDDEDSDDEGNNKITCRKITAQVNKNIINKQVEDNSNLAYGSYMQYNPGRGRMDVLKHPISSVFAHTLKYASSQLGGFFAPMIQTKQLEGNLYQMYQGALYQKTIYNWNQQQQSLMYSNLYNGFLTSSSNQMGYNFSQ